MKYLIFILLFAGCAGSGDKVSNENGVVRDETISPEIQKEFDWIENSNFVEESAAPFVASNDQFEGSLARADALSTESIARLPAPKIESAIESDDVITKLAGLCHGNKFEEAFSLVQKQHRKYRRHPAFWNQVGTCHLGKRDYRSAILFYNKAREFDAKYAPPLNNLGVVYQIRGSLQKAALAYKEATKVNPLSVTPIYNLAQLQLAGGQVESAILAFQALVKCNDEDVDALAGFATALLIRGDIEQSVRVFDRLPSNARQSPVYGTNYALSLKLTGNDAKAREILSQVASSPDQNVIAYYNKVKNYIYQVQP